MKKFKTTSLERSWILYDVGNSAFVLLCSTLLPIYFNALATGAGVDEDLYLSYWGYAGSIATLLVAIIGPICGAMADLKGFKKPIFMLCMILGVLGCAALGIAQSWVVFLGIYIVAKVGFSSSLVFYDSMLPEVTTDERSDRISSMGFAYGYIGSVIPFVACLALVLGYEAIGISQVTAMIIAFLLTAAWWLVCSLPISRRYQQTAYVERKSHPVRHAFVELGETVKHAVAHKNILMYLVAYFFFINGVNTIIDMATAYGTSLGLDTTGLLLALLLTQVVAFPCALIFGHLATKVRSGKLIKICIASYTGIALFAVFLVSQWQFWMLAVLVGMFQGAIQALARSYLGKIIPPERSGSYFGLMDICGKGASFLGMLLVSLVNQLTAGMEFHVFGLTLKNDNLAVSTLLVLFAIGFVLFHKADKMNRS